MPDTYVDFPPFILDVKKPVDPRPNDYHPINNPAAQTDRGMHDFSIPFSLPFQHEGLPGDVILSQDHRANATKPFTEGYEGEEPADGGSLSNADRSAFDEPAKEKEDDNYSFKFYLEESRRVIKEEGDREKAESLRRKAMEVFRKHREKDEDAMVGALVASTTAPFIFFLPWYVDVAIGVATSMSDDENVDLLAITPMGRGTKAATSLGKGAKTSAAVKAGTRAATSMGKRKISGLAVARRAHTYFEAVKPTTFIGHSRDHMRRNAARLIGENPKSRLRFLLDEEKLEQGIYEFRKLDDRTHANLIEHPKIIQMGHSPSESMVRATGIEERVALEAAWLNQMKGSTIEKPRSLQFTESVFVDVDGVAVDYDTVVWWIEAELLKPL